MGDGADHDEHRRRPPTALTTRRIGFADRPVASEITHIDPPRAWGVRGIDGGRFGRSSTSPSTVDEDRSRATIELDFAGHGIGKLLVPLAVRRQARR